MSDRDTRGAAVLSGAVGSTGSGSAAGRAPRRVQVLLALLLAVLLAGCAAGGAGSSEEQAAGSQGDQAQAPGPVGAPGPCPARPSSVAAW